MASLLKVASRGCSLWLSQNARVCRRLQPSCFISTSKKTKDSATVAGPLENQETFVPKSDVEDPNWISYGYRLDDKEEDMWISRAMMFALISGVFCVGGFILAYQPDFRAQEWAQREAYLELARREREGLPLINRWYVDPSTIDLPSEEELGDDFEIII